MVCCFWCPSPWIHQRWRRLSCWLFRFHVNPEGMSQVRLRAGLNPLDVVAKVRELLAKLAVVEGLDALSREAQRNATLLFFAHARATLAAKRVLREHRLSAEALDYVVGEIEARFHKARRSCA